MERKYLQINNLVASRHAPGYVYRIVELNQDTVNLHPRAGFIISVSYDDLQPIPLSADYLLDARFVVEPNSDPHWYSYYINAYEKISVIDLAGPHFDIVKLEKAEILSNGLPGDPNEFYGVEKRKLYHVHQFQNFSKELGHIVEFNWED